jgi:shikimate kinase/3-dehydroquinate synthase
MAARGFEPRYKGVPMRLFLSGPMGSGKSTVGRLVSGKLGLPFIDLDSRIEERTGRPIADYFLSAGEPEFRRVEAETLEALLREPSDSVVALGGGACLHTGLRRRMLEQGILITLMADPATLATRVSRDERRPLLMGKDPAAVLETILALRRDAYAECHAMLEVANLPIERVVDSVLEVVREAPVVVPLGPRTYRVEIGRGVVARLRERLGKASSVVLVTDQNTTQPWGARAEAACAQLPVTSVVLPAGESHKHVASVEQIWDAALEARIDRRAHVVAVGGGVVGDVAGFAAATLLRGVAVGHLPTTVVSMVDSAVGGKTGIDRAQGKNLVGAFHQPRFVLADIDTLSTLPREERISGLAEVAKSAWLDGEGAVAMLEERADALREGDLDAFGDVVRMAVRLKARIVSRDEHENGERALLNLGHTVGHAIEAASNYATRHGEAVSMGLLAAFRVEAHLNQSSGPGNGASEARLGGLLAKLGLPVDWTRGYGNAARGFLGADKKRVGENVRFILPGTPGRSEIREIPLSVVHAALA